MKKKKMHKSPYEHEHDMERHMRHDTADNAIRYDRQYENMESHNGLMGPNSLGIASTAHVHEAPKVGYALHSMSDGSMNYLKSQDGKANEDTKKIKRTLRKEY